MLTLILKIKNDIGNTLNALETKHKSNTYGIKSGFQYSALRFDGSKSVIPTEMNVNVSLTNASVPTDVYKTVRWFSGTEYQ